MELSTIINGISLTKVCTIKPDSDSEESKQVTLNIRFNGVTLRDICEKAISNTVIQWQGANRKNFDRLVDKSTINVDFKAPGRQAVDPKAALIADAKAAGVDVTNVKALMKYIEEQIEAMNS